MESRSSTASGVADGGDATSTQQDSKRVGKLVQPVALFLGATSFGLIINRLPSDESHVNVILVTAHTTFVYLSLFMGVGLSIYSILNATSPEVAWVQKKLMVIALVFISLAFVLRTCVVFPIASLEVVWLLFLLFITLVVLYLVIAWKREGYSQTARPQRALYEIDRNSQIPHPQNDYHTDLIKPKEDASWKAEGLD